MECIEHKGYRQPDGYGQIKFEGKAVLAHRLAYARSAGVSLASIKGSVVLHSCDNPTCVNPEHLSLGSHQDNMADMVAKSRQFRKLLPEDREFIVANAVPGKRGKGGHKGNIPELAAKFNVSCDLIRSVLRASAIPAPEF